ncbi:hypothetical protein D3C72_2564750 [compost metagenome]
MIQILENFAPFQLSFVGNIRQLLPQTFFDDAHKYAVRDFILTLFVASRELFQIASHGSRHLFDFGTR